MNSRVTRKSDDYYKFYKMILVNEEIENIAKKTELEIAHKRYTELRSSFWERFKFLFTGI